MSLNYGSKKIWVSKIIKNPKKNLGQIFFGSIDSGPVFLSKKTGRVKPRWRIYDPPPSENSRVKILLGRSYLSKKIFVKKNICRFNPGRGGVDSPPPENSRVKIVLGCC